MKAIGAISIERSKAYGKTWCARCLADSEYPLEDPLNNFSNCRMVAIDSLLAIEDEKPHLIDEWQDITGIWDALQQEGKAHPVRIYVADPSPCTAGPRNIPAICNIL